MSGVQVHIAEPCRDRTAISHLVEASGASLLSRPPIHSAPPTEPEQCKLIVLHQDSSSGGSTAAGGSKRAGGNEPGVARVSHRWLTDSAGAFTVMPLQPYAL